MQASAPGSRYDLFLCHNSQDKPAVRTIHERLRQECGLETYLDEATLVGGEAWESAIQGALSRSAACAVIVGPHGWGKYQLEHEVRPAVRRRDADPAFRVIPVLLPGVDLGALADFESFFSATHWISFAPPVADGEAIRTLASAVRGMAAFPEGPPRLTAHRLNFDTIRWDAKGRRDESLLYIGQALREAEALARTDSQTPTAVLQFLAASRRHHDQRLAMRLAAHARVIWNNPRRRDLAARLALESVSRASSPDGFAVLRHAFGHLHSVVGRLTHPAPVAAAAFDPAHARLATGCVDGSVCRWDGRQLVLLGRHTAAVRAVADLSDGRFVSAGEDGDVIVWSWAEGRRVGQFATGTDLDKIEVRRDEGGVRLLSCSGRPGHRGEAAVWNVDDGAPIWRMGMVMDAAFDASGKAVAVAWGDHVLWQRLADREPAAMHKLGSTVTALAVHPAEPLVAASTFDRHVHMISFAGPAPTVRDFGTRVSPVGAPCISPDGACLAVLRDDLSLSLWNLNDGTRHLMKVEGLLGIALGFGEHGRYLAVRSPEARSVTVWGAATGVHVCTIELGSPRLALLDEGRNAIWVAGDEPTALFVRLPTRQEAAAAVSPGVAMALKFSPDSRLLAWIGTPVDESMMATVGRVDLVVVDFRSGALKVNTTLDGPAEAAFDAASARIAALQEGRPRVWDLTTGAELPLPAEAFWPELAGEDDAAAETFLAQPGVAKACAGRGCRRAVASADGRRVLIDHGHQLVSLWDRVSSTQLVEFSMEAAVSHLEFSLDGELCAAADERGGVAVWRADGSCVDLLQHDEPISCMSFSPDGCFLAVASTDLALKVWIVSAQVLAERVRAIVSGPLDADEWARYLGDEPREDAAVPSADRRAPA